MTEARERAIKMYWEMAKEKCPFQTEEIVNGYLEGFIDCAELFEEEDKFTLTKYARIIIDKKDECIEKLEKENAELIQENEEIKKGLGCETCQIHLEYMRLNDKIRELEQKLEQTEKDLADYQFNYPTIKELEKENAELKEKLKEKLKTVADKDLSFVAKFDALERENAELKDKLNKIERKCKFNFVDLLHDVENESKQEKQLIKAKEIIKDLMSFSVQLCDCRHTVDFEKTREQAVQFIKEIEK